MGRRLFSRDFMEENDYPMELMDQEFIEDHRWYSVWSGVFPYEDKHYQVAYLVPATEMQEEDAWNGDDTIEAVEVVKAAVVIQKWVEVDG